MLRTMAVLDAMYISIPSLAAIPTFSLMNHDAQRANTVVGQVDIARHRFGIAATEKIAAGGQILFDYGRKCKERMVVLYGFAPRAAPPCAQTDLYTVTSDGEAAHDM